ncbi:OmpA family protein [Vibrio ziniensis]|uniref:MotY family protein n=1 Tax=Vibrio ziniensis TaxID=2711221 RepID=UPI001FE74E90|nr:OmpA family protein [Vibrio ziniensis]
MFVVVFSLLMMASSFVSYADEVIDVPMDLSAWNYKEERAACNLIHTEVPHGKFYFRSERNHQITFDFKSSNKSESWKYASLSTLTPPWIEPEQVTLMSQGYASSPTHFSFRSNIDKLLKSIEEGKWLKLSLKDSSGSQSVDLILPSIRVQQAISEFLECKKKLPSITYAEAKDTYVYYASGQKTLSTDQLLILNNLVSYIRWDDQISQVLIDGHTDSTGSRLMNINVSKQRAEEVAQYLDKLGIGKDKMQIRAHGSRYPMTSNDTEQGRSKNRRVVIRIVKNDESVVQASPPAPINQ